MAGCLKEKSKEDVTNQKTVVADILEEQSDEEKTLDKSDIDILSIFLREMGLVQIEYNHSDYYLNEDKLKELTTAKTDDDKYEVVDIEDYEEIIDIIIENSKNADDNFNEDLEKAIRVAVTNIVLNATNNIDQDLFDFKNYIIINRDLKSLNFLGLCNCQDNIIEIDYSEVKNIYDTEYGITIATNISFVLYLAQIIEHELNHVRQLGCSQSEVCEKPLVDDIYRVLIESSAESELMLSRDAKNRYSYYYERKYENLLFLLGVFKENNSIENYYNAMFDSNIGTLLNFFNISTEEDIKSFYDILYAINTLTGKTALFDSILNNEESILNDDLRMEVGYDYLISIFSLCTKNLIREINGNKLTLDESILLYNLCKCYITDTFMVKYIAEYNNNFGYQKEVENINRYLSSIGMIEELFYEVLCLKFNNADFDFQNCHEVDNFASYVLNSNVTSPNSQMYDNLLELYPILKNMIYNFRPFTTYSYVFNCIQRSDEWKGKELK